MFIIALEYNHTAEPGLRDMSQTQVDDFVDDLLVWADDIGMKLSACEELLRAVRKS